MSVDRTKETRNSFEVAFTVDETFGYPVIRSDDNAGPKVIRSKFGDGRSVNTASH